MTADKSALKRCIDQSMPKDLLVLTVNNLQKDSISTNLKRIDKFMNNKDDYIIAVIKK